MFFLEYESSVTLDRKGKIMYELKPLNLNQKSFYGKALVDETEDGITLYSYNTPIVTVGALYGEITVHWDGWSVTTGKHLKEFFLQLLWIPCNKKLWGRMQNGEITTVQQINQMIKDGELEQVSQLNF